MHYTLTDHPKLIPGECLVIGFLSDQQFPDFVQKIDKDHQGLLTQLRATLSKAGNLLWQSNISNSLLLMIHCGDSAGYNPETMQQGIDNITEQLLKQRISTATICFPQLAKHTPDWQLQQMLLQINSQCYQLLTYKSKDPQPYALQTINFMLTNATNEGLTTALSIAAGINLTRNLADLPANVCTPTYLAKQAQLLATEIPTIKVEILQREDMQKLGMGSFLGVAQGSAEPPTLINLHYNGATDSAPIILVGKGVTFDSGGISLKSPARMHEMKFDMAGAASVIGTIKACALLKLPINLIGLIGATENMPGGKALKPGDIVTSLSGQTIEITNTDAEGRLILADLLTYAARFKPKEVIDIATLTGAIVVALGNYRSGFMTNNEKLAQEICKAADESNDLVWRMPMDKSYHSALDSPIADMQNASLESGAGSVTAACFLSKFTEQYTWAHLDIAGTAWVSGKKTCATGRPVALLVQLLRNAT